MLVEEHVEPEEWLRELREWETAKAREELLRFLGVGRKVADCVLLMSLDKVSFDSFRRDAFPPFVFPLLAPVYQSLTPRLLLR